MTPKPVKWMALLCLLILAGAARAQLSPHIGSMYPGGATTGKTVDVEINGGNLIGVHGMLIGGAPGVSAQIVGGANPVDESARPIFQSKCTTCHEERSPANRSKSPEDWAATVTRMITKNSADISVPDRARIITYLQGVSKAGKVSARITVAANAAPGLREMRLLTDHGASTPISFEVGTVPEMDAPKFKTGKSDEAVSVKLPISVNGTLSQSGERHWFRFDAKKGQRLTFNLKAERINAEEGSFFFPTLFVYNDSGHELAKNLGKFGVDPFVDFLVPADGAYLVLVHDLLWHGSPGSVYRLTMGPIPAEGVLSPGWAKPGASISARLVSADAEPAEATPLMATFPISVPTGVDGMTRVQTPVGEAQLLVRDLPDGGGPQTGTGSGAAVSLPALFRGGIAQPGQKDTFLVRAARPGANLEVYAQRLGSPLHATVTVRNLAGDVIAARSAEGEADLTIPNAFPRAGDYTVEVSDADGKGGPGYLYCWEAADRTPSMDLTVTPDVANVSPGKSMTLLVKAPRRQNIPGPIIIGIHGLPPGVTAADTVLLPDMNEAVIILTAAPDAPGGTGTLATVEGRSAVGANNSAPTLQRSAAPVEIYLVNNNQLLLPRTTLAVAVQAVQPSFTLTAANGRTELIIADGSDLKIPVKVQRQPGSKSELFVTAQGLPPGISMTQGTFNIRPTESETTVVLRVNHDSRFFKDKPVPGTPPVRIVIAGFQGNIGNDFTPQVTTPPITLTPK